MGLTKGDKDDLNRAILEYLYANGYKDAHDIFIKEAEVELDDSKKKLNNILETKWKSVARLKKQIL
jgi:hypothetical protein